MRDMTIIAKHVEAANRMMNDRLERVLEKCLSEGVAVNLCWCPSKLEYQVRQVRTNLLLATVGMPEIVLEAK